MISFEQLQLVEFVPRTSFLFPFPLNFIDISSARVAELIRMDPIGGGHMVEKKKKQTTNFLDNDGWQEQEYGEEQHLVFDETGGDEDED